MLLLVINMIEVSANTPTIAMGGLSGCDNGIRCREVQANGLTFNCRFAGPTSVAKPGVLLLHGFPEWSSMYMDLMRALAAQGHPSVACDQRGYSPKASPATRGDYEYMNMVNDTWGIAAAAGLGEAFHLIGHDHGACLGWKVAGEGKRGSQRILSYTALSIPHIDAFSAGLVGPDADRAQQA